MRSRAVRVSPAAGQGDRNRERQRRREDARPRDERRSDEERERRERDRREREDRDGRIAGARLPPKRAVELAEVGGRAGRRPDTRLLAVCERDHGRRDVRDRYEAGDAGGRRLEDAAVAAAHDRHGIARVVPMRARGRQRDVDRHRRRPRRQLEQRHAPRNASEQRLPRLAADECGQRAFAADGRPVARGHEADGSTGRVLLERKRRHDDDRDDVRLGAARERERSGYG